MARDRYEVEVDGRTLRLSNLDRVLYPATGFTKGDLIDFYGSIAPVLIPHLEGRPLTLRRFPDGVEGEGFWEKRCPAHHPEWVETAAIWSSSNEQDVEYCVAGDRATLVWAANLAAIELHASLATAEDRSRPDSVVFDLDPGAPADAIDCARIALLMKETFAEFGLKTFVKSSGSKGLQLYIPLNSAVSYEETSAFARQVAMSFEAEMPARAISKMKRSLRPGKVFIDWSQNSEHKTTVCAYSMRARTRPAVSTPLGWAEVEQASETGDSGLLSFDPEEVLQRVERDGDLFAGLTEIEQDLPEFQ